MDSQLIEAMVGSVEDGYENFLETEFLQRSELLDANIELSQKGEELWETWKKITNVYYGVDGRRGDRIRGKSMFLASSRYSPETRLIFHKKNDDESSLVKAKMVSISDAVLEDKVMMPRGIYRRDNGKGISFLVKSHRMGVVGKIDIWFEMTYIRIIPTFVYPWFSDSGDELPDKVVATLQHFNHKPRKLQIVLEVRDILKSHGYCTDAVTAGVSAANQKLTPLQLNDAVAATYSSEEVSKTGITYSDGVSMYKLWKAMLAAEKVQRYKDSFKNRRIV